ncbi:MAG: type III pantothenate kinase [Candidatus Omnitrophota bacterium]
MLLAIDIGNTNIKSAIFKGKRIIKKFSLPISIYTKNKFIKQLVKHPITDIVICSVVPKLTTLLKDDLAVLTGKVPYIIGKDLNVALKNNYRNPKQLGQDRLVNAFAASKIYSSPAIIIDSGSAITFDLLAKNNTYLGGLILPGFVTSLRALNNKTALLPLVKLAAPKKLIGNNTQDCILSGVVFGTAALTKEITAKLLQRLGKDTTVIGTGGNIALIKKHSAIKIKIDVDLTLKGINLIYEIGTKSLKDTNLKLKKLKNS